MSFIRGLLWGNNSRHKKLCEEWGLANSCESVDPSTSSGSCSTTTSASTSSASASSCRSSGSGAGSDPENGHHDTPETVFELKYLGSTLVESPNSEKETADAIKNVLAIAKASGKKLPRVSLAVSLEGMRVTNLDTEEELLRVSLYSISYCSADGRHGQVFAFISTNLNDTLECHAFMCPKRKVAQSVAITVSQAFNSAYELWQLSELRTKMARAENKSSDPLKLTDEEADDDDDEETDKESLKGERTTKKKDCRGKSKGNKKNLRLDLNTESNKVSKKVESWVSFEDEITEEAATVQPSGGVDGGIPMKSLKSPTSPAVNSFRSSKDAEDGNETSPSTTPLMSDAWQQRCTESRPLDVVCSS